MTIQNRLAQIKNTLYSVAAPDTRQKDYLLMLEKACKVNKSIFIDRNVEKWQLVEKSTGIKVWAIDDAKLSNAAGIVENNIIGRYRVDNTNSDGIYEIWEELDCNHDLRDKETVKKCWPDIAKAAKKLLAAFNSFGISSDYIQIKTSGRGLHFSVFCTGFRDEKQYFDATLYIQKASGLSMNIKQSESKGIVFGFDSAAIGSSRRKIRELGGQNDKLAGMTHYVSLVTNLECKSYPFVTKPKDVIYPSEIKIFEVTRDFVNKMHEFETEEDTKETKQSDAKVLYNLTGDASLLLGCPLIAKIDKDGDKCLQCKDQRCHECSSHATNPHRIFLSQTFPFFGETGEKMMHRILSKRPDFNERYTQNQIENVKKNNRKPITCKWAQSKKLCPDGCTHKINTPVTLAWKKPSFAEVKDLILKNVILYPGSEDVVDFLLAMMIERYYPYGKPVWVFLIAASGAGKTKLLKMFTAWKQTYYISEVKKKDLVSGYKEAGDADSVKYGILEDFDNKTVIIDDMSQILSGDKEERNAVFGTFRLVFDGEEHKGYGNRKGKLTYKADFGMVMGMTPIIDAYYALMNQLGERFIKVRFKTDVENAMDAIFERDDKKYEDETAAIQNKVVEFLESVEYKDYPPPFEYKELIKNACKFTAQMRTPLLVQMEGDDIKGTPEAPTRLMIQCVKLYKLLACIHGKDKITDEEINFVGKTLMQTPPLIRTQAYYYLLHAGKCTINAVADALAVRHEKARKILDELVFLHICSKDDSDNYALTPQFATWGTDFDRRGWFRWLNEFYDEFNNFKYVDSNSGETVTKRNERRLDKNWLNH